MERVFNETRPWSRVRVCVCVREVRNMKKGRSETGDAAADVDELARLFFRATLIPVSVQKKNKIKPEPKPDPDPDPESESESESEPKFDSDQKLTTLPRAIRTSLERLSVLGEDTENNLEALLKQAEYRRQKDAELSSKHMNAEGGNVLWYLRKKVLRLRLEYVKQSNNNTPQVKKKQALDELRRWAYHFVMPDRVLEILFEGQEFGVDDLRDDNTDLFAGTKNLPKDYKADNKREDILARKDILTKRLLKARIEMLLGAEWRIEDEERYVPDEWTIPPKKKPWTTRDALDRGFDEDDEDAWTAWMAKVLPPDLIASFDGDPNARSRLWRNANRRSEWNVRKQRASSASTLSENNDRFALNALYQQFQKEFRLTESEETNFNNIDVRSAFLLYGKPLGDVKNDRAKARNALSVCGEGNEDGVVKNLLDKYPNIQDGSSSGSSDSSSSGSSSSSSSSSSDSSSSSSSGSGSDDVDRKNDEFLDSAIETLGLGTVIHFFQKECETPPRPRNGAGGKGGGDGDFNDDFDDDFDDLPTDAVSQSVSSDDDDDDEDDDDDDDDDDGANANGTDGTDGTDDAVDLSKSLKDFVSNATYFKSGNSENPENPENPEKPGDIERLTNAWNGSDDFGRNRAKKVFERTNMLSNDDATPNIKPALDVFDEVVPGRRVFLRGELEGITSAKLNGDTIVGSSNVPLDDGRVFWFKQHVRLRMVEVALISDADVEIIRKYMPPTETDETSGSNSVPSATGRDDDQTCGSGEDNCVTEYENVKELLGSEKFGFVKIRGDGNCFFRAIAEALGDQRAHPDLRKEAVDRAMSSPHIAALVDRAWAENMSRSKREGREGVAWADEFAIQGLVNALGVCLEVYKERPRVGNIYFSRWRPEENGKCDPGNTIVLLNTGGDMHFDLLTPLGTV